jgi:O-antigen ligase
MTPAAHSLLLNTQPATLGVAIACLAPTLLAYNLTPASTLFNQLLALSAWGGVLVVFACRRPSFQMGGGAMAAVLALGLCALALLASALRLQAPQELGPLSTLFAAAAVLWLGASEPLRDRPRLADGLAWGCLLAGLAGVLIGLIQVFAPQLADGQWLARSGLAGRAIGNVRQPNHLATLLLMGCVALIWLAQRRNWPLALGGALMGLLVFGVVLTASRTGLWFGVPLLVLWGLLDRQLPGRWRLLLLATPLLAGLAWLVLHWWAASGAGVFGAEARLDQEGAGSPSRLKILANAWALLQQQPWTGVGWGEFNRAWTLTPFPDRPVAFFDHSHNLPLQLLVELGWPLGLAVMGLLLTALAQALRLAWRAQGDEAMVRRAALMLVVAVGLHSLLEYPLWYAYFLLPTAFALGLALAPEASAEASAVPPSDWAPTRWMGMLLIFGCAYALWEFQRVSAIYQPGPRGESLQTRIERGQLTVFFSRHADYAAATSMGANAAALAAAERTGHQLIDVRLMMAWAKSLHAVGETDKARYMVARLREFRSREGEAWLATCADEPEAWFCKPPEKSYSWRDF